MDFPQYKFSLYFLTSLPQGTPKPPHIPGTKAAHEYLWNHEGVTLELTHNHGTESDPDQSYHAGNQERDGFGHIAVKWVHCVRGSISCPSCFSVQCVVWVRRWCCLLSSSISHSLHALFYFLARERMHAHTNPSGSSCRPTNTRA
jgi:hypothetical protein